MTFVSEDTTEDFSDEAIDDTYGDDVSEIVVLVMEIGGWQVCRNENSQRIENSPKSEMVLKVTWSDSSWLFACGDV